MDSCKCDICSHHLCAKKVPIFSFLSDDELQKIVNMTGNNQYNKGDIIGFEGEKSDTLFILNEGLVKLSKITKDGKEQIVRIVSSGDFFGELNLFGENQIYNFNAYAITDVKLCTLTKQDMDTIILKNPEISLKILSEVTRKLRETENLAQTLATNDAEIRVAFMIAEFSEKYGIHTENGIEITCPINREEMANYTGVARETVSRKLKKFEELGIIRLVGSKIIIVKDELTLKDYLQ